VSKGNTTEGDILSQIFTDVAVPWAAATDIEIHLHTADPGEGGTTATNECTYTNYAAASVTRGLAGWTVSGAAPTQAANDALIQFPQCGVTGNTITHVSVSWNGSTQILYSGALNAPLAVANLIQPQFAISALVITED
jgi:hypothetical protein